MCYDGQVTSLQPSLALSTMPYFAFLFICLVWGSSFILIDRAAHAFGPVSIGMIRLLGGALVLSLYWLFRRESVKISLSQWGHIGVIALTGNALPFVLLPYVMRKAGEHGYFGMMVALVPLATILASIPMLNIWPSRRQLTGVVGGLICIAVVIYEGSQRGISTELLLLALVVPISYAVSNTYIKWKLDSLPPLTLTILFLGLGGLMLVPLLCWPAALAWLDLQEPTQPFDWTVAISSALFLGIFSTGIAVLFFIQLIKDQGPLFAGMVTYVVPMLALVWGQYDKEALTTGQLLAIGGVLTMVALVQWGTVNSKISAT